MNTSRVFSRASLLAAMLAIVCTTPFAEAQSANVEGGSRTSRNTRVARGDDKEMRLDTTVAVERGTIVDLSASDGRITVRGWDRNEVEIHAVSSTGELQFSRNSRSLRLEARRSGRLKTLDATISVRVPLNTRVVVGTMLGDVEVLDVRGEVDATLYSGNVTIRGASGRTAVSNVSGDINVSDIDGALRVTAISGEMTLSDIRGDVEVSSNSGDVSMRGMLSNLVHVQVVEGEIWYDGALSKTGKYEFNTHSGDVHLYLPDSTKGTVSLQSFNGSLHSTLPLTVQPGSGVSRGFAGAVRQFNGRAMSLNEQQLLEIGGGNGAMVTISTFNGDVHINRGPRRPGKDS
ncbi:MAG: DUF4097 family beta strand repeat-containing protein [Gemmatimonadaceae bacterium]